MSSGGGVSIGRTRGENRFYNPPAIRQRQQQQKLEQEKEKQQRQSAESDDCATSYSSGSSLGVATDATNLDRFLEYTTPVVPAQYFPKTSVKGWRTREHRELHPYFMLGDLWESFKEWSAYGAGVPLLLNGSDSVIQYYVPYLSGIQLYVDSSKPSTRIRRPGDESDAESSRETSSDGSDYGIDRGDGVPHGALSRQNVADVNGHALKRALPRHKTLNGSSSDESGEVCNPPGQLIFQYMEHDQPFGREPLADKVSVLASQCPELRTYRSCDLSPSSWVSVAWYPIYRIPTGPTLQSLDACFLTFHSLSTPIKGTSTDRLRFSGARTREVQNADFKLPLPIFGLASYKFKVSFWNLNGVSECQKANSLLRAADNWLRLLQVNHPDFNFFVSHSTPRR